MEDRWLTIVAVATAGAFAQGQSVKPLAQWRFDESQGPTARDSAGGVSDSISGLYKFARGVSGNALQFDGYTTYIQREWKQAPPVAGGFTVEAWVALDAYPWNWVPIVDWERDFQAGLLVRCRSLRPDRAARRGGGIVAGAQFELEGSPKALDPRGRELRSGARHRTLHRRQKAGEMAAIGALTPPERTDLLIGRVREKMMPVPSGLIHPRQTIYYSLEGVLDELTIHGPRARCCGDRHRLCRGQGSPGNIVAVGGDAGGAPGPGRFGAYYATLKFQDTWDRLRRIGPESDVVVRFPQSGMRLVFWQGNNYVPAWVTRERQMVHGRIPGGVQQAAVPGRRGLRADVGQAEPLLACADSGEHGRARSGALAVCAFGNRELQGRLSDPLTGWFDWADEYWTVYPDGVAVRKQVLWSSHLDGVLPGDKVGPGAARVPGDHRTERPRPVARGQHPVRCPHAGQHER